MKRTRWGVLLALCVLPGCLNAVTTNRKTTPETVQALPGANFAPTRAVQPEQVNEQNARQQCAALTEEIDREMARPH
jgi:hypothetical protein